MILKAELKHRILLIGNLRVAFFFRIEINFLLRLIFSLRLYSVFNPKSCLEALIRGQKNVYF